MALAQWFVTFFVFAFGLAVGSFLNVVILRLGKRSILGRSQCPNCGRVLGWRELIPLASFFVQAGRCRGCGAPISRQYPFVEGLTATIFILVYFRFLYWSPFGIAQNVFWTNDAWWIWVATILWWYYGSTLIAIAVYDAREYIIPDAILTPAAIISFLSLGFFRLLQLNMIPLFPGQGISFSGPSAMLFGEPIGGVLGSGMLAAVFASGFLGAIYLVSKGRGMGFGDVKLGLFMGFALGWPDILTAILWPDILTAILISFVAGTIVSLGLIVMRRRTLKSYIPFGPFLAFGTMTAMLFGDQVMRFYFNILPSLFFR